jgi:hypothetical protein
MDEAPPDSQRLLADQGPEEREKRLENTQAGKRQGIGIRE